MLEHPFRLFLIIATIALCALFSAGISEQVSAQVSAQQPATRTAEAAGNERNDERNDERNGENADESGPVPPAPYFSTVTPTPDPLLTPSPTFTPTPTNTPTHTPTPLPTPTSPYMPGPMTIAMASNLPESYTRPILDTLADVRSISTGSWLKRPLHVLEEPNRAGAQVRLRPLTDLADGDVLPLMERYYAVVVPFDTVEDDISLRELQLRWQGIASAPLFVTAEAAVDLPAVLGERRVQPLSERSWKTLFNTANQPMGILPFEKLDPSYKVLTVDGVNVLDNRLDGMEYPLAVGLTVQGNGEGILSHMLRSYLPLETNRTTDEMTTLVMTGVTAMARGTARRMETYGPLYPALIISDTLAAADITHISNEVPFLDDCVVNDSRNNLTMCSHTDYWAALEAVGTDLVGLSGNHVNDFGRSGARRSIGWYRENSIPIYGSGMTIDEACAPLTWEHNGNTFAFVAALAFGPEFAWATDELPGACYYYDHKEELLQTIRRLARQVDVVAVELQFEESYNAYPLPYQVTEFREIRAAGAHLVTGVQSHVPQAMEPYASDEEGGAGIIVYGLGNLFFDQMQNWNTRTELIARHTIYQGRILNTEILTTVLEDYAQPRWATKEERQGILRTIFSSAPRKN